VVGECADNLMATGVAAVRAADVFLITMPSQAGKHLDGDHITTCLEEALPVPP
jgi:hypothetical protein